MAANAACQGAGCVKGSQALKSLGGATASLGNTLEAGVVKVMAHAMVGCISGAMGYVFNERTMEGLLNSQVVRSS
jgi:hypothetical protein